MLSEIVNQSAEMGARLKAVARHWLLLEQLSREECSAGELAKKLQKKPPEISKAIQQLADAGLINPPTQKQGDRHKYCSLSDEGRRIYEAISEATARPTEEKPKVDLASVEICIDVLKDESIDEDTRHSFAQKLSSIFTTWPLDALDQDGLKKWLEETLTTPPKSVKIWQQVRSMMLGSLPGLMQSNQRDWVKEHVYEKSLQMVDSRKVKDNVRLWAASILEKVAFEDADAVQEVTDKLEKAFLEFEPQMKDDLPKMAQPLISVTCSDSKSTKDYVKHLRETIRTATNDEKKQRLGYLLQTIATRL